ncbi:MAG: cysteine dioxygenase family protein [Actinomycetota bacterium]|nr:cysteine dioxygenase family protein [Actinomycetota bacterium]
MRTAEAAPPEAIAALVQALDLKPQRLSGNELTGLVRSLADAHELWRPLVQHIPSERWYRRLHRTDGFEVWLLGWEAAQDTQIHDHGGASGAFYVAEGALVEYHSDRRRQGPMLRDRHRRGGSRAFEPSYVHNLVNEGPGFATSLHAYSPPLTKMSFYRRTIDERLELDHTLEVDGPEPSLLVGGGTSAT